MKPAYKAKRRTQKHPWRQACPTRKYTYGNDLEACLAAVSRDGTPYKCPHCPGYHLTSQPQRSRS